MIVVDANVVMALIRDESMYSVAREIYAADSQWVVPTLWQSEVLNALLNEVKAGHVDLSAACAAADNAADILRGRERDCPRRSILETAHNDRLTAYDATYVALARMLGVPLVSEDRQILRTCPDVARSMRQFLQPPPVARENRAAYRAGRRRK